MKTKIDKGRENKFYKILVVTVGLLLAVFFTSKSWMYDDNPIAQTPFHTDIHGLEQTIIQLNSWEYNPHKELMEISISTVHKGSDVIKPSFSFAAREQSATEEYPVEIVYYDENSVVVQLREVKEDYNLIGLYVREHRDEKIIEHEHLQRMSSDRSINQDGDLDEEIELPQPKQKIIVGDYRTIKINNDLDLKDRNDYQIEIVIREVTQLENQIKRLKDENLPLQNDLITQLKEEIKQLENEKEYQIEEEKEETDNFIKSKNKGIEDAQLAIEKLNSEIETMQDKQAQLEIKLQNLQAKSDSNKNIEAENNEEVDVQEQESEEKNDEQENEDSK